MKEKTDPLLKDPFKFIKDPFVLEFLNIPQDTRYREKDIESAIISHLQEFLLELGNGFSFVARQKHIRTESSDLYIDLVFYHINMIQFPFSQTVIHCFQDL